MTNVKLDCFGSSQPGRNGGHLTPFVFLGFHKRELLFGTSDAAKGFRLESHTSFEILEILRQKKLSENVDLVEGGHITLLVTDEEGDEIHKDYEAAKAAGVNLTGVEWVSKEEMLSVSNYLNGCFHWRISPLCLEIWCILCRCTFSRT